MDSQVDGKTDGQPGGRKDWWTVRWTERLMDSQVDRKTDGQPGGRKE